MPVRLSFRNTSLIQLFLAVAFQCGFQESTARGELIYTLYFQHDSFGLPEFGTEFIVAPRQEIENVRVVLREQVTGGSVSVLATNPISSFEAKLSLSVGTDAEIRDLMLNTANGSAGTLNAPDYLHYFGNNGFGLESAKISDDVYETLLGWVTIYGPTSGSAVFQVVDPRPQVDGDFGLLGNEEFGLESLGTFSSSSITLTAVPEPGSLCLWVLLCAGRAVKRRFSQMLGFASRSSIA